MMCSSSLSQDRETQAQQFPTSPDDKKHGTDQRKDPQPCKESVSTPEPFPHRQRTQAEDVWKKDDLHQSSDPPLLTFTPEVEMEACYPRTQSPHGDQAVEITPRANSLHGASSKETHNTTMVENGDNEEIEEHCLPLRRHPVARRQSMTLVLSACHTAPPPLKPVSQAKGLGNSSGFNPRILYFDQNHYDRILMPPPKSTVSLFRKSRQLQMRRALDEANSAAGQNSTTHVTRVSQPADPKPRSHCGKRCRWARDGYESDEDEGTPRMRKRRRRCGSIFGATNRQLIRRHRRSSMSLLGRLLSIDWWKNMLFNFFSTGGGRQASDGSCSRERHD